MFNEDKPLEFTELRSKLKGTIKVLRKTPGDHRWRKIIFGKARYI